MGNLYYYLNFLLKKKKKIHENENYRPCAVSEPAELNKIFEFCYSFII